MGYKINKIGIYIIIRHFNMNTDQQLSENIRYFILTSRTGFHVCVCVSQYSHPNQNYLRIILYCTGLYSTVLLSTTGFHVCACVCHNLHTPPKLFKINTSLYCTIQNCTNLQNWTQCVCVCVCVTIFTPHPKFQQNWIPPPTTPSLPFSHLTQNYLRLILYCTVLCNTVLYYTVMHSRTGFLLLLLHRYHLTQNYLRLML